MDSCVFCRKNKLEIIKENGLALAFYDARPISEGHSLVIPKRHVETFFDANADEHAAMIRLIFELRKFLHERYRPDGFNIGSNVGLAAGQTVFHFHIHVIPRYSGDVPDPRGGVRKVIPRQEKPQELRPEALH